LFTYQDISYFTHLAKWLLAKGARVDELTFTKTTALHMAALQGHTKIIEMLLENGIQIDYKSYSKQDKENLGHLRLFTSSLIPSSGFVA
jgi:ankyrin repeat protein